MKSLYYELKRKEEEKKKDWNKITKLFSQVLSKFAPDTYFITSLDIWKGKIGHEKRLFWEN